MAGRSLLLTPEQMRLMDELVYLLPKPPEPGLDKQQILEHLCGRTSTKEMRESRWRQVYDVILITRRKAENREPGTPLIVNTGRTAREPRYQTIGFIGPEGQPCLFNKLIQLEHARIRRLQDLRTRATSASELLALKYLVDIAEALDNNNSQRAKELYRMFAEESLFIVPCLSLVGQLLGVPYQQARSLPEMVRGFRQAIEANPRYSPFLGKLIDRLYEGSQGYKRTIERPLAEFIGQIIPLTLLVHGPGRIRERLDEIATHYLQAPQTADDIENE